MDEAGARAALEHYIDRSAAGDEDGAHEIYTEDAVLEFPQSGERFEGVANLKAWRKDYPATVDFEIRRIRGAADVWVVEVSVRYDGGPWAYGISIHEFRDDRISREAIYYAEAFPEPEWRLPGGPRPADRRRIRQGCDAAVTPPPALFITPRRWG